MSAPRVRIPGNLCYRTLTAAVALLSSAAAPAAAPIPWRNGPATIASPASRIQQTLEEIGQRDADGPQRVVIQLAAPISDATRAQLRAQGVELLNYVGADSFFATISPGVDALGIASAGVLAGVAEIDLAWKLDPFFYRGELPEWTRVDVLPNGDTIVAAYVLFHKDVDVVAEGVNVAQNHGAEIIDFIYSLNGMVVEAPASSLTALAGDSAVQWVESALPQFSTTNSSNRARVQADQLQAAPYGLNGSGVTVFVYDGDSVRQTHGDLAGRVTDIDSNANATHATHVACTVGGAGAVNAANRGMAPSVLIISAGFDYTGGGTFLYSNPGDIEVEYNLAINTHGADISNNSIGTNTETNGFPCSIQGDYGVTSALIDAIVAGSLGAPFRVVWANGNERQGNRCDVEGFGDYYSTAPPAGSKNHIAVGAVNSNNDTMTSFSSWGPVDDGRIKPDISAPGCESGSDNGVTSCSNSSDTSYSVSCGTSMASPTTAGVAALILQDYRAQFPGQPDFRNSTLKGLLAHTAVDLGNVGPDYQFGYGSIRAQAAVDFLRSGQFVEASIGSGALVTRSVTVAPGSGPLKWTLVWDDPPAASNAAITLVHDLDLIAVSPSGQTFYPWTLDPANPSAAAVRNTRDNRNNIEQVVVDSPEAGEWKLRVKAAGLAGGSQV